MKRNRVFFGIPATLLLTAGVIALTAQQLHREPPPSMVEPTRSAYYWMLLKEYDRAHPSMLTGAADICVSLLKQYGGSPETCAGNLQDRDWVLTYTLGHPVPQLQRVAGSYRALLPVGGALAALVMVWLAAWRFELNYSGSEARRRTG